MNPLEKITIVSGPGDGAQSPVADPVVGLARPDKFGIDLPPPIPGTKPFTISAVENSGGILPDGPVIAIHPSGEEPAVPSLLTPILPEQSTDSSPAQKEQSQTSTRRELIAQPITEAVAFLRQLAGRLEEETTNSSQSTTMPAQTASPAVVQQPERLPPGLFSTRRTFVQQMGAFVGYIFRNGNRPPDAHLVTNGPSLSETISAHLLAIFNKGHGVEGQKLLDMSRKSVDLETEITSLNPKEAYAQVAKKISEKLGFDFVAILSAAGINSDNCLAPFVTFSSKGFFDNAKAIAKVNIPLNIFRLPAFQEVYKQMDKGAIKTNDLMLEVRKRIAPPDLKSLTDERRSFLCTRIKNPWAGANLEDNNTKNAYDQIENMITSLAQAVAQGSLNAEVTNAQMDLLINALVTRVTFVNLGAIPFATLPSYEPEVLELLHPMVLAELLNRVYSDPKSAEALNVSKFANNIPCLTELFATGRLKPQTALTLLNRVTRDPFLTARLTLQYSHNLPSVQRPNFLVSLNAKSLSDMSLNMIKASFVNGYETDQAPSSFDHDTIYEALWTQTLQEIGNNDFKLLVDTLSEAEKSQLGAFRPSVYGVLTRKFCQNLIFQNPPNYSFLLKLEAEAWKAFTEADFESGLPDNFSTDLLKIYPGSVRSRFAVWSGVLLANGSSLALAKKMHENETVRNISTNKERILEGLTQLSPPSICLLIKQLNALDPRTVGQVPQSIIELLSFMDTPKKDISYIGLLDGFKLYLEKHDGLDFYAKPQDIANIFTVLFKDHPIAGVMLFKYLSRERVMEAFRLINDRDILLKTIGTTAIYYYYFGTNPIGVVPLSEYDFRQLDQLASWNKTANFDYFDQALDQIVDRDKLLNFVEILSQPEGNARLALGRFLTEFWANFTRGKMVLGNIGNQNLLQFLAPSDEGALETNRILASEIPNSLFERYEITVVGIGVKPISMGLFNMGIGADNRIKVQVRIKRKDGSPLTDIDLGTLRDEGGDLWRFLTNTITAGIMPINVIREDYKTKAEMVIKGLPVTMYFPPSYLLNAAFLQSPRAMGVAVLAEWIKQSQDGKLRIDGDKAIQLYKRNGPDKFEPAEKLQHQRRFLWIGDLDTQNAGDADALGLHEINGEWWAAVTPTTDDFKPEKLGGNIRWVKVSDLLRCFPVEEQAKITDRTKNIAMTAFTIAIGLKFGIFGKIAKALKSVK